VGDRLPYAWLENEALDSGAVLLAGGLYGVNEATEALARTMEPLSAPAASADPPPPEYWIKAAVLNMAAIGVRSARAATIIVRYGYAPESLAALRALHESVAHIKWVLTNPQGDNARNWLMDERGRRTTGSRVARQSGSHVVFDALGKRVHVTQSAAQAFRDEIDPNGGWPITVVPAHRERESRSILFAIEGKLLEMCELLGEAWGLSQEDSALNRIRLTRKIDATRHDTIETLLSLDSNPYRDSATAAGSFI
jgi:hypothetical protein